MTSAVTSARETLDACVALQVDNARLRARNATLEAAHRQDGETIARQHDEIERLQLWIRRIDNINDEPARFSAEIDQACVDALNGKPMTGLVNAYQQTAPKNEQP